MGTAQERPMSRVEQLSNSIDTANCVRTVLSQDLATSEEMFVSRVEELSNGIRREAKAQMVWPPQDLSHRAFFLPLGFASKNLTRSQDTLALQSEAEDGASLSKDLLTSQVAPASEAEELFRSIDWEVEHQEIFSKDLAKC